MACGDVLVKSVAFAVVVSPSHLFSDRVGFDIELDPLYLVRDDRESG